MRESIRKQKESEEESKRAEVQTIKLNPKHVQEISKRLYGEASKRKMKMDKLQQEKQEKIKKEEQLQMSRTQSSSVRFNQGRIVKHHKEEYIVIRTEPDSIESRESVKVDSRSKKSLQGHLNWRKVEPKEPQKKKKIEKPLKRLIVPFIPNCDDYISKLFDGLEIK